VADAADWIRENLADAPQELSAAMEGAVAPFAGQPVPQALADGAILLYADVVQGDGARGAALPLLAADALLTHAFQAVAEIDPNGLSAFAAAWTQELAAHIGGEDAA
jgi:hypothetical protein